MTLRPFELRWLTTIMIAVLPLPEDRRFDVDEGTYARFIEEFMRRAPRDVSGGLRFCTWLLQACPPLLLGRVSTFTGLPQAERMALLERLAQHRIALLRELPLFFKMVACLGICGLPSVQRVFGITPIEGTPPAWARTDRPGLPVVESP